MWADLVRGLHSGGSHKLGLGEILLGGGKAIPGKRNEQHNKWDVCRQRDSALESSKGFCQGLVEIPIFGMWWNHITETLLVFAFWDWCPKQKEGIFVSCM